MTLSHREQTLRAVRKAAREVARDLDTHRAKSYISPEYVPDSPPLRDEILEMIREHLWCDGPEEESAALEAYHAEREKIDA